jgi:hypothetical protein
MKTEIYTALAQINGSFEQITAGLKNLQSTGVVTADYVREYTVRLSEICATVNVEIIDRLSNREIEDKDHFGKMRANIETGLKSS